jgi:hypothetical protein
VPVATQTKPVFVIGPFTERPSADGIPLGTVFVASDIRYSATVTAPGVWTQTADATYYATTATLVPGDVGRFARLSSGLSTVELNTAAGTASLGVIVSLVTLGAVQLALIATGAVHQVATDGAAIPAQTAITNDMSARAVAAGGGDVVAGMTLAASVGATVAALIVGGATGGGGGGPLPLGGDLAGTTAAATVTGLQTQPIAAAAPSVGDVFMYQAGAPSSWGGSGTFVGPKVIAGLWTMSNPDGRWVGDFTFLASPGFSVGILPEDSSTPGDDGTGVAVLAGSGAPADAVTPAGNGAPLQFLGSNGGDGSGTQPGGSAGRVDVLGGFPGADNGAGTGTGGVVNIDAGTNGRVDIGVEFGAVINLGSAVHIAPSRGLTIGTAINTGPAVVLGADIALIGVDGGGNGRFLAVLSAANVYTVGDPGVAAFVLVGNTSITGRLGFTTAFQIQAASVASETSLLLQINRGGIVTFERVTIGGPDSAGAGFRALCVAN